MTSVVKTVALGRYKWRVAVGMQQREVWADDPYEAAHICGLGSGTLTATEMEVIEVREDSKPQEYVVGTMCRFTIES